MTIVGVASAKGAPGVTVTSIGLMLLWSRPVLLVEADATGGDLLAGYLAGTDAPGAGILGLALAARRGPLHGHTVIEHTLSLNEQGDKQLLTTPLDRAQLRPVRDSMPRVITAVSQLSSEETGRDLILDLGRVSGHEPDGWLGLPTVVLLLLEPTLRGAAAAEAALASMQESAASSSRIVAALAGHGTYGPKEISNALGVPVAGVIARDEGAARALSGEAVRSRSLDRSPLIRSLRSVAAGLARIDGDSDTESAEFASGDARVEAVTA